VTLLIELRFQTSPGGRDRPLLVYADDLEQAKAKAAAQIPYGGRLIPHRARTFPDARSAHGHYIGGLWAKLDRHDMLAFLEDWERERDPGRENNFDRECKAQLNRLRAANLERALADPNSPEAVAMREREQRERRRRDEAEQRRAENLRKQREARRTSGDSQTAEARRARKKIERLAREAGVPVAKIMAGIAQ